MAAVLVVAAAALAWLVTRGGGDGADEGGPSDPRSAPAGPDPEAGRDVLLGNARPRPIPPAAPPPGERAAPGALPARAASQERPRHAVRVRGRVQGTALHVESYIVERSNGPWIPPRRLEGGDAVIQVAAGETVLIALRSPGALFPGIRVHVSDPPPAELELVVPTSDDTRWSHLRLLVVDAATREPLPDAALDLGEVYRAGPVVRADAAGRIAVPEEILAELRSRQPQHWWSTLVGCVSEPAHHGCWSWWPDVEQIEAFHKTGLLPIPLPTLVDAGVPVRVRLVDVDGAAIAHARVRLSSGRLGLGDVTLRCDDRGEFAWGHAPEHLVMHVRGPTGAILGVVVASSAAVQAEGLRSVQLPRTVRYELTFERDGKTATDVWVVAWRARPRFLDGLDPGLDAEAPEGLPRGTVLPPSWYARHMDWTGPLGAPGAPVTLDLPTETDLLLQLGVTGGGPGRSLRLRIPRDETRRVVRWEDVPLHPDARR